MFIKMIKLILAMSLLYLFSHTAFSATITKANPKKISLPFITGLVFNINPFFSSEFNTDIGDITGNNISEAASHVSILSTGDNNFDYYSFNVSTDGITGVFDIDSGATSNTENAGYIDTEIAIWNNKGEVISFNDDISTVAGADGSSSTLDAFIQYTFDTSGTYVIGVAEFNSTASENGWSGNVIDSSDKYTLNIALGRNIIQTKATNPSSVPIPPAIYLFLIGIISMVSFRRIPKDKNNKTFFKPEK